MTTSTRAKSIIAIFVAVAIAPVASASAAVNEPVTPGHYSVSASTSSHDSDAIVLRRDGSQAVPFVADLGSEPAATGNGVDWGDAAIGVGAALLLASLAMFGSAAIRDRRSHTSRRTPATSQSA